MTLVPWRPMRELTTLENEMSRLFSSFFGRGFIPRREEEIWAPLMDVHETRVQGSGLKTGDSEGDDE